MENESTGTRSAKPIKNGAEHLWEANSEIARKLNDYYQSLLFDEVPDHLTQLLAKLEKAEARQKEG